VREICGNPHESSVIVKRCFSHIFWSRLSTTDGLATFYTIVLHFLHSLHFGRKPSRIIHDGFPQHSFFFSTKNVDSIANFAAGGIINRINSLCRGKNQQYVTSYLLVHYSMSHVALPCMREHYPAPALLVV
jgi:hypothetical protein